MQGIPVRLCVCLVNVTGASILLCKAHGLSKHRSVTLRAGLGLARSDWLFLLRTQVGRSEDVASS
jgi:hypothetical protein